MLALKAENISKQYRLGQVGTGTLTHDLNRFWHKVRGKEDPYLKIGEANDRSTKGSSEYVWSLQDINFEIEQGDAVGIIGRNGAGKSTLLKILSKVTKPTTGKIFTNGRIASLLEVGTGFHPEMTGRENVFLNGAILGMTKKEITRKFDEIVDFSGVERYIDTPVKRYSSGMYVRLAFAVAAHLESEILIVDEVLAVGDAEFQKKCLGKMGDVSKGEGRTVLFVSHNLTSLNSLCKTSMYLRYGKLITTGDTPLVISEYLRDGNDVFVTKDYSQINQNHDHVIRPISAELIKRDSNNTISTTYISEEIGIRLKYEVTDDGFEPVPNFHFYNAKGDYLFVSHEEKKDFIFNKGTYTTTMWIPGNLLNDGRYTVGLCLSTHLPEVIHFHDPEGLVFDVIENMDERTIDYRGIMPGLIRPELVWETEKV